MIIYSDITNKRYETVDECLADEKKVLEAQEKAKREAEALEKQKDEAYEKAVKACEEYFKLCGIDVDVNFKFIDEDVKKEKDSTDWDNFFNLIWKMWE